MKKYLLFILLFKLNPTTAQTFEDFFGIDSNEVHYQIWLRKYSNSFDTVIKHHSFNLREDLRAFDDSLAINVYLEGNNNLIVEVNKELMVSIKKMKHKLIVNERGLIHEFTFNKTIKRIKLIDQDRLIKVRFKDGKIFTISKSYEFDKKYLGEEFLNRMEKKFNYFIETKV